MMKQRRRMRLALAVAAVMALPWAVGLGRAQTKETAKGQKATPQVTKVTDVAGRVHTIPKRITQAERQAAADRLKAKVAAAGGAVTNAPGDLPGSLPGALPPGDYLVGPNNQLIPDYSGLTPNWAYSPLLTKFVDPLPDLKGLIAKPDVVSYPGSDYYEIELFETSWQFHSQLPTTTVRLYKQTNAGTNTSACVAPPGAPGQTLCTSGDNSLTPPAPAYLGPVIVATKGRPVRVKFTNNLPTGAGGNLQIPVDTTVMGSGPGSNVDDATRLAIPADVLCAPGEGTGLIPAPCYTQNRATLHLHGGVTPWISDGTTHQWITPAGENTAYPNGVSVYNVPDMPSPGKPGSATNPSGSGVQTFYWTNDQAARLMFYHDHAHGITRLNVYAGEAAGYLLRDDAEKALETAGLIPGLMENIPLVIQEKTFVDAATIGSTDPTWNWGTGAAGTYTDATGKTMTRLAPRTGDLWWPHVYQPAQNPSDLSGYNAMGRWNYGPWFFPPTPIPFTPVLNPYYDCDTNQPCTMPQQPYEIPGTPNPSWGAEAFLDTPVVNGKAYPTLTVEAKAYRFRILNAGGDRFFNLQLFKAFDKNTDTTADRSFPTMPVPAGPCTGPVENCTEVKMVQAAPGLGLPANWPQDGRAGGVPDPTTVGPSFNVIGTEGGFLPMPVEVKPQPVVWNGDPLTFNFGNVSDFSLLLGPAERADAVVDFTGMEGQTFILYNDAPAAFPASDPRNDYYTGNPDQRDTGGTVPTLPGLGPNTRTIMQIRVIAGGTGTFSLPALKTEFTTTASHTGVFKASQDEIVVGQSAYNAAYGKAFPSTYPWWGLGTIFDSNVKFETVGGTRVTLLAKAKAIHDEMGATFDDYGRMKASLGVQMPNPTPNLANFIMQGYADPATELVKLVATPIGNPLTDGTQIWRVNHNGVDTHPIHFHLFHVQLVNRVGWDGAYRLPHPTELGWKDTVRISPLEDTYVALRPIAPMVSSLPFKLPNSFRPLEPALPIGSTLGFTNIDPLGNPIAPGLTNQEANFGWEYVWHCHILSHEENDMMRAIVFAATPETPAFTTAVRNGALVNLAWTDNSLTSTSFTIQRDTLNTFATPGLATFTIGSPACANSAGCPRLFTDTTTVLGTPYYYRVLASNTVGSAVPGYPTITADSPWSNVLALLSGPVASVTPGSLAFGNQAVNTTSAPQAVTLSNTGGAPLTFTASVAGADFAQTNACGGTVAVGGSCVISLTFTPTVVGARSATLSIASNDPAHNPLTVALTGTGVATSAPTITGTWIRNNQTGTFVSVPGVVTTANQLLLAFVSADAPATGTNTTVSGLTVTSGGALTWTLVRRTNTQRGTAEIWRAFATTAGTRTVRVNLGPAGRSVAASATIVAFSGTATGAAAIGATGSGNANPGAPTASLTTTRANSLVLGVGIDWDRPQARTLGPNQTLVQQFMPTVGDTYWVQRRTNPIPAAGTLVTINDTAPTNDRYNLTIVEVRTP